MLKPDSLTLRLPVVLLASLAILAMEYFSDLGLWHGGPEYYVLGSIFTVIALLVALRRSGMYGMAFWFTLASGYVLLSPLFSYALGYSYFSEVGREFQKLDVMSVPILEGSLAVLIMAVTMSPLPISASGAAERDLRIRFGPRTNALGLLGCCVMLIFMAWLSDPGPIVGLANLQDLRGDRFADSRFAGGTWALFSVLAVYFYLGVRRVKGALLMRIMFFLSIGGSLLWLFLHARRSETLGYMIFLYCVLSPGRGSRNNQTANRLKMPEFINRRTIALVTMVLLFAAIGYYRTTLTWNFGRSDFLQAPGGAANNLLGYVSVYDINHRTGFGLYPGETYVGQLQDLPPEFMGFPRAPDAYGILSQKVKLIGGQYWLMEPLMNFGGVGVALYALLIAWLGSLSVRAVRRGLFYDGSLHAFLQGGTFLALMYRLFWYGPAASINGAIMAALAGGGLFVLSVFGGAMKRNVPVTRIADARRHDRTSVDATV